MRKYVVKKKETGEYLDKRCHGRDEVWVGTWSAIQWENPEEAHRWTSYFFHDIIRRLIEDRLIVKVFASLVRLFIISLPIHHRTFPPTGENVNCLLVAPTPGVASGVISCSVGLVAPITSAALKPSKVKWCYDWAYLCTVR
ncbi:hypothetical protein ElyMa_001216800 [Elysia marginata]|uniref:Uncharacterized protein n=1 Tax=Elysia marginata TaxID=1093978 RepID=A0AAV4I7S0_9GAST|nr:hypothetical protein ElyMa_001216800 [Elysia marginata]